MDPRELKDMVRGETLSPLRFPEGRPEDEEWQKARLGMITGSEFGKLVVKKKDRSGYTLSSGKVAERLIYQTVWERLLKEGNISNGLKRINFSSQSVEHGIEYEPYAIQAYMEKTGNKVDYEQKFVEYDNFIGGTPDGYIGEDGLIEVKCPENGGNTIWTLVNNGIYDKEYLYQIQGYLWITGRKWCDFVVYDPDVIDQAEIHIIRVERDEEIIKGIAEVMEQVKEKIREIMAHPKIRGLKKNS